MTSEIGKISSGLRIIDLRLATASLPPTHVRYKHGSSMWSNSVWIIPLTIWAVSACGHATAPSHLLVGNWKDSSRKNIILQMRLSGDSRGVVGVACGIISGYLSFRDARVEVDGRTVRFAVTKESAVSTGFVGNRFVGELKDDGTIVGKMPPALPFNVTFARSETTSGTCEGAPIYSPR